MQTCLSFIIEPGDDAHPLDPGLGLLDAVEHVVDDRPVEAGLLPGEVAQHVHLDLVGQVGDDRPVGLEPPEHERAGEPLQGGGRRLVAVALDGNGEAVPERRLRAEQAGVEEVHQRPQLEEPVLDRRAGERHPGRGRAAPGPPGPASDNGFFTFWASSRATRPQGIWAR